MTSYYSSSLELDPAAFASKKLRSQSSFVLTGQQQQHHQPQHPHQHPPVDMWSLGLNNPGAAHYMDPNNSSASLSLAMQINQNNSLNYANTHTHTQMTQQHQQQQQQTYDDRGLMNQLTLNQLGLGIMGQQTMAQQNNRAQLVRHHSPLAQLSMSGALSMPLTMPSQPAMGAYHTPDLKTGSGNFANFPAAAAALYANNRASMAMAPALPPLHRHAAAPAPSPPVPPINVSETVTLSTLTCLIEKQYTIRKTESDRMTEQERKQLVPVHVRILKEKTSSNTASSTNTSSSIGITTNVNGSQRASTPNKVIGVKRERDESTGSSASSSTGGSEDEMALFIPATDIGPLLNIRKNNIPGYISKYDSSLRQQMMVDCPRAAGGIARVQLNVLTIAGAEKFIVTSRSKQADKVWTWIQQHVNKVRKEEEEKSNKQQQSPSTEADADTQSAQPQSDASNATTSSCSREDASAGGVDVAAHPPPTASLPAESELFPPSSFVFNSSSTSGL